MGIIKIETANTQWEIIDILEVSDCFPTPTFFGIKPTYYNCHIVFSPRVIQKILQWMLKEHYIELDGTLTIKVRTKGVKYVG